MDIAPTLAAAPSVLAAAPTIEELDALAPIDEARLLSRLARECGTLPPHLAARRLQAIARSVNKDNPVPVVAAALRLQVTSVYRLLRQLRAAAQRQAAITAGGAQ